MSTKINRNYIGQLDTKILLSSVFPPADIWGDNSEPRHLKVPSVTCLFLSLKERADREFGIQHGCAFQSLSQTHPLPGGVQKCVDMALQDIGLAGMVVLGW